MTRIRSMPPPVDLAAARDPDMVADALAEGGSDPASAEALHVDVARLTRELAAARAEIARLAALADEDPLCGILNRRGFERELRRAVSYIARYGGSACLLIIDLDDFKDINDREGHRAGDELLKRVAAALAASLRASDVLARIGGDEFAVILWQAALADGRRKARRLATSLPSSASVGVAAIAGPDEEAVFAEADASMYRSKRRRKAAARR